MTKNSSRGEFKSFVGGLVTEASVLNFPEQAARDINNFILNRDGSISRRPGFGFEQNFDYIDSLADTSEVESGLVSSYVWEDPAGQSGEKYILFQSNDLLLFYDLNKASVSLDGFINSVTLPAVNKNLNKASYASVDGKLVIATGDPEVYLVTYDTVTTTFSVDAFSLQTRDLWGVSYPPTDNDPTFHPRVYDARHVYNLYNQSWAVPRYLTAPVILGDASRQLFLSAIAEYPSDSETVWLGMGVVPTASGIPREKFDNVAYRGLINTTFYSSKGSFIIDLLDRGASREAAIAANSLKYPVMHLTTFSTVEDLTERGASVVCEYSGRVFYAGFGPTTNGDVRSPDLSSYVAFSRLVRNSNDFGKCYQEGDPTSNDSADVVDTDGGLIRISGAINIRRMIVQGKNLMVIADNGVWAIEGGSDFGFSATNYRVDKISTFGGVNSDSVISDGSKTYFWAEDSIYVLLRNELGDLIYQSLSEATIASFYNSIPITSKVNSKGIYDKVAKKLRWIYQEDSMFVDGTVTNELVFDLVLNAFYKNTITNLGSTAILDVFASSPFVTELIGDAVFADVDRVFVGLDDVFIEANEITDNIQTVKYVAGVNTGGSVKLAIGWYNQADFSDWGSVDGAGLDAAAFIMTGSYTAGDSSIHKQTPVLVVHMTRTEDSINSDFEISRESSCKVRTMWDFANSINSKKFSPLFQVYRYRRAYFSDAPGEYDNGFEVVTTRNKLRGRGRAFSMYMETEPEKDCKIIGWNLSVNGNSIA